METTLRTPRLILRPLAPGDIDAMHAAWNDPEVGRFLWDGRPVGRGEVEDVVAASEELFRVHGWGLWAIVEGDRAVGFCGLRPAPFETGVAGDVELLYGLERTRWGRGLATEAAKAVLDWLAARDEPRHVVAATDPGNLGSRRVLGRLGIAEGGRSTSEAGAPLVLHRIRG